MGTRAEEADKVTKLLSAGARPKGSNRLLRGGKLELILTPDRLMRTLKHPE